MQVDSATNNPVTSPANTGSTNSAQSAADATNAAINSTDSLGNENTFLQLLVAQIQNQDPTQPIDSTTFLTQLASFSQLEQLIGIRQDVQQLDQTGATTSTDPTSSAQN